jgi:hypothetical protein
MLERTLKEYTDHDESCEMYEYYEHYCSRQYCFRNLLVKRLGAAKLAADLRCPLLTTKVSKHTHLVVVASRTAWGEQGEPRWRLTQTKLELDSWARHGGALLKPLGL